jgi:hypothetical protein
MELVLISAAGTCLGLAAELFDAMFTPSPNRCLSDRQVPTLEETHGRGGATASVEFASPYDQAA